MLAISILFSVNSYSQGNFLLHFGVSFPESDFGDDNISKAGAGGARTGFDVGLKYLYPITNSGLNLFVGGHFIYNGLQNDAKETIENNLEQLYGRCDIRYYQFINLPLIAGLNYTHLPKGGDIGFFGELGLGIDFMKITRLDVEADNYAFDETFYLSTDLAVKLGGGIIFQDRYSLGLHYLMLGRHKVEGKRDLIGASYEFSYPDQDVSMLTFTLGIKI